MSVASRARSSKRPVAPAPPRRRGLPSPPWPVGVLIAAVVIFLLITPMLWNHNFIGYDWYAHLWYIWHMEGSLRANGFPSLFTHNILGVFDPHYAFYGGTLYALTGTISLVVGRVAAFVITWIGAFAMGYGGLYWLARMAGASRLAAHAPSILFVASPWWLSSIYAWGSWGQAVAISSLVLLVASGISILRADRLRLGPAAALAASTTLYTGSHNLTMAWASTLALVVAAVLLIALPSARALITRRGLKRLGLIMLPAFLVNAWFFLPNVIYQGNTFIAKNTFGAESFLRTSMFYVDSENLLRLTRTTPEPNFPHLAFQLPLLAFAWIVAGLIVFRPRLRSPWLWAATAFLTTMVVIWQLMTHVEWILALPMPYDRIQAPYRLEAYITLGLAGATICALALGARAAGRRRYWTLALIPIVAITFFQGKALVDEPLGPNPLGPSWSTPQPYQTTNQWMGAADYVDARLSGIETNQSFPTALFQPEDAEKGDRAEVTVAAVPGQYVVSNLKAATWLVRVEGARIVALDRLGNAVLQVDQDATPGAARITVEGSNPWPVVLGRIASGLALLTLAIGAATLLRRRRRERSGPAELAPEPA
jgi:hypothetical protein